MKVVIDTNVFISSFFGGNPKKVIDLWKKGDVTLCLSKDILDEYIEVINRIGLKNTDEIDELLLLFSKSFNILFTTKTPQIKIIKVDPDDDKFIECAVALKAGAIITGDKAIEALTCYGQVKILTPLQFLKYYTDKILNKNASACEILPYEPSLSEKLLKKRKDDFK